MQLAHYVNESLSYLGCKRFGIRLDRFGKDLSSFSDFVSPRKLNFLLADKHFFHFCQKVFCVSKKGYII